MVWSAYWYNGLVFANNFSVEDLDVISERGLDVLSVRHPELRLFVRLTHLNPQTQELPQARS